MDKEKLEKITRTAKEMRRLIIKMLTAAGSGHVGGSLGMADVFATVYFSDILNIDPQNPWNEKRDRVLLSNGHICPVWYTALAKKGFFEEVELMSLRKINSRVQGHPRYKELPGVENSGGPLGQGLSQAIGLELARKMKGEEWRVICLMSDGELQEGSNWEALMFAGKNKLEKLTIIIDRNGSQIDGRTEDIMPLEPLGEKLRAFGWEVREIDGHNPEEIYAAVKPHGKENRPVAVIAKTILGKGVDFIEGKYEWHGKVCDEKQAEAALLQLQD